MGTWATAKRAAIVSKFESASGDMRGDVEPVFVMLRRSGADVLKGDKTVDGSTLRVAYTIVDDSLGLDDADVARIFAVAYLDELVQHYYQSRTKTIELRNTATGATQSFSYPDPE
jgi:hypothetical protein